MPSNLNVKNKRDYMDYPELLQEKEYGCNSLQRQQGQEIARRDHYYFPEFRMEQWSFNVLGLAGGDGRPEFP